MSRALLALALALASGCQERTREPAPSGEPRIVSLSPATTEIVFALGLGPQVQGVTRYCDHPPEASALPKIGGFIDPSFEATVGLAPTLAVAAGSPALDGFLGRLRRAGIAVVAPPLETLDDTLRGIEAIGAATGRQREAAALAGQIQADLDRLRSRAASGRPVRTLLIYGHRPLVVAGPTTFAGELLALAGAENVASGAKVPYPTWSMEDVARAAPEVIVDASMGGEASENAALGRWAGWESIPAVRDGRVHVLRDTSLMRPGPRLGEALDLLRRALYPALEANP
jgi:iron complex transport system substrate-binding protein